MKHALSAVGSTVKCGTGLGLSTMFIATMDDLIYSNLRKNIIMPMQMVGLKGSSGTFDKEDVQNLTEGTRSFLKELKPHALAPTNAKELILKDADYSTPQDHYFNYTNHNKGMLGQMSMVELNDATK